MRIGYPCINRSVGCSGNHTFRLASYSEDRLVETVGRNLACLERMLRYNVEHGLLFFRITSDLVPFASHPVCRLRWQDHFGPALRRLGRFVKRHRMRISMHPDQFTLVNSPDRSILRRSISELLYHCDVLDAMELTGRAKIQIHVGGAYGDKPRSMSRFVRRYRRLEPRLLRRLVVENDDRIYTAEDCLGLSRQCGIPVLFDVLHHEVNPGGDAIASLLGRCAATWRRRDGLPMVDYSSQEPGARRGKHAETLDIRMFRKFLRDSRPHDFDIMLEIKDKEASALRALAAATDDWRLK